MKYSNLIFIVVIILVVVLMLIALYKLINYIFDEYEYRRTIKHAELRKEVKRLELETERMKGFPFIKVQDVKIGQFVSNADNVYVCVSSCAYESDFLDLTNRELIRLSWDEVVRKRADLDDIIKKTEN